MPKSQFSDGYQLMIDVLVKARREAGLTQNQVSARLNKPQPFMSKVETGVRRIDVIEFYVIARALKKDPEKLFAQVVRSLPGNIEI